MKRQFDFYLTDRVFKTEENMTVNGNMRISGKYSEFKELVVCGDCFIKETIKAEKLIVYGNLKAGKLLVKKLVVKESVDALEIYSNNINVKGNLQIHSLKAHYATIVVGGKLKTNYISGEIVELSVGEET